MPLDPHGTTVIATQWSLLSIATGVIIARLYLRIFLQRRRLLASDIFMIAAWCAVVALAVFNIIFYRMGVLRRGITIDLAGFEGTAEEAERFNKFYHFVDYPFHTAFYLSKGALLAVYLQIFPDFMVKRRRFLWATITYVILGYIATILLLTVTCLPMQRNWSLEAEACSIESTKITFEVAWALNISGDILIFILPWLVIPELTLKNRLRYSLYATFLLGLINIAFCVVRFAQIEKYGADLIITITLIELWSSIDVCIGLIIAGLPSLRPFFNWREKVRYYGNGSELPSKTESSHASGKPVISLDQDTVIQPLNAQLSFEMVSRSSTVCA